MPTPLVIIPITVHLRAQKDFLLSDICYLEVMVNWKLQKHC